MSFTQPGSLTEGPGNKKLPVYRIFGLNVASSFPFETPLSEGNGTPELVFQCVKKAPDQSWRSSDPVYTSSFIIEDGESFLSLYRQNGHDVLHFTGVVDFYIRPGSITCHLLDKTYDYAVEIYLLGMVLSYWLEMNGCPALHASAVSFEDRAVAFLSGNRGGKSSLACSLMQAGYPLLTDDILPVERLNNFFIGRSGYPQARLWQEEARYFLGSSNNLKQVHPAYSKLCIPLGPPDGFGAFCKESRPLACFYIQDRRDHDEKMKEVEITTVPPRDAVIELLTHSFIADIIETVGMQPQRLNFFAGLARQVPMRRIKYPADFNYLPRIRNAVIEDLSNMIHDTVTGEKHK